AVILGGPVLIGLAFHIPMLVWVSGGETPMVITTAIGFVFAGLALIFSTFDSRRKLSVLPAFSGVAILLLAGWAIIENVFGFLSPLDMTALQKIHAVTYLRPDQMAPNTAVAFLCFGLALVLYRRVKGPNLAALVRVSTFSLFFLGLLSCIGYWMGLENLYNRANIVDLTVNTAIGMMVLGIGLWQLWRNQSWNQYDTEGMEVERIYLFSAGVLVLAMLLAEIVNLGLMQYRIKIIVERNLARMARDRQEFFAQVIRDRMAHAAVLAHIVSAITAIQLRKNETTYLATVRQLQDSMAPLRQLGFSAVVYTVGTKNYPLLGRLTVRPALQVPLAGSYTAWLLWANGYVLRTRIPVIRHGKTWGYVTAEQRLPVLDRVYDNMAKWGKTGTMVVCAKVDDVLHVFPVRNQPVPFTIPDRLRGMRLPAVLALRGGGEGIVTTRDLWGREVLAAYDPIGHTGLGLALKMNLSEVYAPIRQQIAYMLPVMVGLTLLGLLALRQYLKPLLQTLAHSRKMAQENEARFITAVNGSLDSFFILESVRDSAGQVRDFRFSFASANAQNLTRYSASEFKGKLVTELFPSSYAKGFVEHYKRVLATGQTISEEFEVHDNAVKGQWLSHQIVKLGDGVAVTTRDITDKKLTEREIQHQALHDPLTGLANRALLEDRAKAAMARARRQKDKVVIAFLDLDHFKPINDQLGHHIGDKVLQVVARRLATTVRDSDTVARIGGDEFVLILPEVKDTQAAGIIAQRAVEAVVAPIYVDEHSLQVTCGIGTSIYPDDGTDLVSLLKNADQAMYRFKEAGRESSKLHRGEVLVAQSVGPTVSRSETIRTMSEGI
ncbi:MAG: diguanylate cyclase domain-containing protein, partial [Phycisphaerae bacterium]